jgi:hypothetical protein
LPEAFIEEAIMSKYLVAVGLLGLALLAGRAAPAVELEGRDPLQGYPPRPVPGMVALDVLVDGKPLSTIFYRGNTYLPIPRVGAEYQVRVRNHTARRIVALVSVDGLSVINGQPASDSAPGYIVSPGGDVVIKGWRRSLDTVAAFRFVDRADSYAWRKGQAGQIGTIRLVAFEEHVRRPVPRIERKFAESAERGRDARRLSATGSIGTAYGRDVDSRAYYVPFARSARRHSVALHYDTVTALYRAGVPVRPAPPFVPPPEFAPPPPR